MNTSSNASPTAATSSSGAAASHTPVSPPPPELSESDYLAIERAHAQMALQCVLDDLRGDLKHVADPAVWTRRYPWIAIGLAAAAGFAAAGAVKGAGTGSPANSSGPAPTGAAEAGPFENQRSKAAPPPVPPPAQATSWHSVLASLFDLVKVALQSGLFYAAVGKPQPAAEPGSGAVPLEPGPAPSGFPPGNGSWREPPPGAF